MHGNWNDSWSESNCPTQDTRVILNPTRSNQRSSTLRQRLTQGAIVVAMAVGGLSVAGPAAAQSTQEKQNFGSHVSHCARVMGGFNGGHNPSMMHGMSGSGHNCHM